MPSLTKADAAKTAREFIRFRASHPRASQADILMRLGRLYEFPPSTPMFNGPWRATDVAAFILEHARPID